VTAVEYLRHRRTHLQTHLGKWKINAKAEAKNIPLPDGMNPGKWKINAKAEAKNIPLPDGMNPALLKVFEKYDFGEKAVFCLWHKGQLNSAVREPSRILELQDRLEEWVVEERTNK
jgi:hypothetical protein